MKQKRLILIVFIITTLICACSTDSTDSHYDSGYDDGKSDGYSKGFEDGRSEGYSDGYDDGVYESEGKIGETDLIVGGYSYGYKAGFVDGCMLSVPSISKEDYNEGFLDYFPRETLIENSSFMDGYIDGYSDGYIEAFEDPEESFDYKKIPMIPVKSSFIKALGASNSNFILVVEMEDGSIYTYEDVDIFTFAEMLTKDSIGEYYNQNIKSHKYTKVK